MIAIIILSKEISASAKHSLLCQFNRRRRYQSMRKFGLAFFAFHLLLTGYAQPQQEMPQHRKNIFSIGADLVPIAFLDGYATFGVGGSLGLEIPSNTTASFAVNAGYLLYSNYPGSYGGHSGDIEYIPVSFAFRKFISGGFYVGPKVGVNIDVAIPQYASPPLKTVTLFGGFSFGTGLHKKFNPDFSFLYHHTSYGNMFAFQTSFRYRFIQ